MHLCILLPLSLSLSQLIAHDFPTDSLGKKIHLHKLNSPRIFVGRRVPLAEILDFTPKVVFIPLCVFRCQDDKCFDDLYPLGIWRRDYRTFHNSGMLL
jgi:hypothetical protein